ncbi:DUF7260 family protein [Halococcus thailandensis]|uniref:DUF7260 domain-containing protein n=1 Tax=Halococcus thailandensis JCM 13552 TaxID=1227457 RepID=M0NF93_9EURY|nr:hypothetical protein [Halococcus thailandensis]EMA55774.1 hypothetical protein C451_04823 [Halococcus thailandensis JCM 13552]
MTVETHVQQALDRVCEEQGAIEEKQRAYKRFVNGVEKIPVKTPSINQPTTQRGGLQTTTGPIATISSTSSDGSKGQTQIRGLFAETVRPRSTADVEDSETLLETIGAELSDQIAMALTPQNTTTGFTNGLKQGVLSEAAQRRQELRAMKRALDREEASLVEAKDTIDEVLEWITEASETALTEFEFAALRARHERLGEFRDQCETAAQERQSLLHATTSADAQAGIAHHELMRCLYVAFPVTYPVLLTVVRVEQVCDECQRAIRGHLIRRV